MDLYFDGGENEFLCNIFRKVYDGACNSFVFLVNALSEIRKRWNVKMKLNYGN